MPRRRLKEKAAEVNQRLCRISALTRTICDKLDEITLERYVDELTNTFNTFTNPQDFYECIDRTEDDLKRFHFWKAVFASKNIDSTKIVDLCRTEKGNEICKAAFGKTILMFDQKLAICEEACDDKIWDVFYSVMEYQENRPDNTMFNSIKELCKKNISLFASTLHQGIFTSSDIIDICEANPGFLRYWKIAIDFESSTSNVYQYVLKSKSLSILLTARKSGKLFDSDLESLYTNDEVTKRMKWYIQLYFLFKRTSKKVHLPSLSFSKAK